MFVDYSMLECSNTIELPFKVLDFCKFKFLLLKLLYIQHLCEDVLLLEIWKRSFSWNIWWYVLGDFFGDTLYVTNKMPPYHMKLLEVKVRSLLRPCVYVCLFHPPYTPHPPRIIQEILFLQSNIYNCPITGRSLECAKLCSGKRRQEGKEKKKWNSITWKPLAFCQRDVINLASGN